MFNFQSRSTYYFRCNRVIKTMNRLLFFTAVFLLPFFGESCHSSCKKMQKTNGKLISGNYDFGKKKEAKKYKRRNKHL